MSRRTLLLLLLLASAHAQTIRSNSNLVIVPTLVQSLSGEPLPELHTPDFALTDDALPQRISAEHIPHQPLAIVVLLQTGASAPRQFPLYAGLGTMLGNLVAGSPHRLALVTFDSQPEFVWDFTPNLDSLVPALAHPAPGDDGAAITDAIDYGIDLLEQQPASFRRVLLLISQTHDTASKTRPQTVIERLGRSNVTIDTLTFSPEKTWLRDQFTQPRHGNKPYIFAPNYPPLIGTFDLGTPLGKALQALQQNTAAEVASLSGGQQLPFSDRRTFEQQLLLLANQAPDIYTLTFQPTDPKPGLHTLRVDVPKPPAPLKVSARTVYWSAAPAPQP